MARLARWSILLPFFVLLAWVPGHVPGYGVASAEDYGFSVGSLLRSVVDPIVLLLAIAAALLAGGWRGRSRALAVGGRVLLWGAFALSSIYVVSFYWPAGPASGGLLESFQRREFVKYGAIPAVTLGALILIPAGEAAAELGGKPRSRATRLARAVDALATVGLFGCTLTVLLSVFVYRAPVIGQPGSGRTFLPPTTGGFDSSFVLFSTTLVVIVASLALLSMFRPGPASSDSTRFGELAGRFARASLPAGVLIATLVEIAGMNHIALTGGQANPAELQDLVGRMLVPVAAGLLLGACAWLLPAAAGWNRRPS